MDIKSTMSKYGFGHRGANHIVIDGSGELWLAMAPVAIGGFLSMGMNRLPGSLRVEPLEGGEPVPYTYAVTESLLELETGKGAKVRFAIDLDAQALRIKGNTDFRLNAVDMALRSTSMVTNDGVVISVGAARYLMVAKKGTLSFDDTYLVNDFSSVTPVLDVAAQDGEFELCVYDLPADKPIPVITKTLEQCAEESSADFKAFYDGLVDIPAQWDDVKEKIAYAFWLCQRALDGKNEVTVENKYSSKNTNAALMAIVSMAFKDAKKAVNMLLSYPATMPPVAAIAAARLIDDNMLCDSRNEIYRVYAALEPVARYCVNERTIDKDGLSYYAYRYESGIERSPEFFKVGEPVLAPDLNAYLILTSEILGKLAKMEYDDGVAKKWEMHAKALTVKLIAELWDGESFIGKNAYTEKVSKPDEFLSLIPILLGSRLPADITSTLATKIDDTSTGTAIGLLLAGGLFDAGEKTAAAEIVAKTLESVRADGIQDPFFGASLLAMAHKVL